MRDLFYQLDRIGIGKRFALDVASVVARVRDLGLLHLPTARLPELENILLRCGLKHIAHRTLQRFPDEQSREGVLRCDASNVSAIRDRWSELWFGHSMAHAPPASLLFANPGLHLGYPPCCVEANVRRKSLNGYYRHYFFDSAPRHWEINRLCTIFNEGLIMPDFFPCSLSCLAAKKFALPFHNLAKNVLPEALRTEWEVWMRAPLTLYQGSLIIWPDWELENGTLRVEVATARKQLLGTIANLGQVNEEDYDVMPVLIPFLHVGGGDTDEFPSGLAVHLHNGEVVRTRLRVGSAQWQ